jgi:hypothetical protein
MVTQAQVLLNLGREDALDRGGLARLVASINRYLGEPDTRVPADAAGLVGDGLRVTESRPMGTVHLLDGLWDALGVDTALRKVLGPRRFSTDVERVLFALVMNEFQVALLTFARPRRVVKARTGGGRESIRRPSGR